MSRWFVTAPREYCSSYSSALAPGRTGSASSGRARTTKKWSCSSPFGKRRITFGPRKGLRQVVSERQLARADFDHLPWFELGLAFDRFAGDQRSVAALQVTNLPGRSILKDFAMMAAADFVMHDDPVRGRPADRHDMSRRQPVDIAPFVAFPDYQIRNHYGLQKASERKARHTVVQPTEGWRTGPETSLYRERGQTEINIIADQA